MSKTPAVRELSPDGDAFSDFLVREERPALFSVLWPIIPVTVFQAFDSPEVYLAAAFFTAIGVERNVGE